MKISQYDWNWWFVLTCISICCTIIASLIVSDVPKEQVASLNMFIIISSVIELMSLLSCLYIGMKSEEE
jgi:hypothetical protein